MAKATKSTDVAIHDGAYVVVARRFRPQSFDDLIGQPQVTTALSNAINQNRVGHAYLFTGARGVGKTSSARIFAKCLNCQNGPTTSPCQTCDICQGIAVGEDIDVLEIDGASNRGIDEIRQLRSNVNVRPSRARNKIYIIDEVHMLTMQAFNALLKTLEEPPEHVKFIFCTTEPEKIPITVLSRCQRFDFMPVEMEAIKSRLIQIAKSENVAADDDALAILARRAAGSMRDSQSLLEQLLAFCEERITVADVNSLLGTADSGVISELVKQLSEHNSAAALTTVNQSFQQGVDAGQLASQLLGYFRDMMAVAVGCEAEMQMHTNPDEFEKLKEFADELGLEKILAIVQILDEAIVRMRMAVHSRVLIDVALVRICNLENLQQIADLIQQLSSGQISAATKSKKVTSKSTATDSAIASSPAKTKAVKKNELVDNSNANELATARMDNDVQPSAAAAAKRSDNIHEPASSPNIIASSSANLIESEIVPAESSKVVTSTNVESIWRSALDKLGDTTADFAGQYSSLKLTDDNCLVVSIDEGYQLAACKRPERKARLEQVLQELTGQTMRVDFVSTGSPQKESVVRKPAISKSKQIREVKNHPMVRRAIELFDAEIVGITPAKK